MSERNCLLVVLHEIDEIKVNKQHNNLPTKLNGPDVFPNAEVSNQFPNLTTRYLLVY